MKDLTHTEAWKVLLKIALEYKNDMGRQALGLDLSNEKDIEAFKSTQHIVKAFDLVLSIPNTHVDIDELNREMQQHIEPNYDFKEESH